MTHNRGIVSTAENPGKSKFMLYIRDVVLPFDGPDCLIWPFSREQTGYAGSVRRGKKMYIHRYVCELIHGEPPTPKHHAAHSCNNGPGGCVNPKHISWKTNAENQLDRYRDQARNVRFKLLPHQVEQVRALRGKEPVSTTAARFGMSVSHTKDIQNGRARVGSRLRLFSDDEVHSIRAAPKPVKKIAAKYGVDPEIISKIRRGATYRHVPQSPASFSSGERGDV
jgi:hypothetical protein